MKRFVIYFVFLNMVLAASPDSTDFIPEGPYLRSLKISHYPPEVLIINRPYNLDLFTGFAEDSIEQVSLFLKIGDSKYFREIILEQEYGRYRYPIEAISKTGIVVSYFFTVTLKGYGLYVVPAPPPGKEAAPVVRTTMSPIDYFRQKRTTK